MTDFATQQLVGPVISPLVSKDQGDFSNRVSCAGEQLKNNVKTIAADTVVIGGTAAGIAATKDKGLAKFLAKPLEFVGNELSKMTKAVFPEYSKDIKVKSIDIILKESKIKEVPTVLSKLGDKIKKMPTRHKAIALVAGLGLTALTYIGQKYLYIMGQIDQKYTDKAKLKAKANETV